MALTSYMISHPHHNISREWWSVFSWTRKFNSSQPDTNSTLDNICKSVHTPLYALDLLGHCSLSHQSILSRVTIYRQMKILMKVKNQWYIHVNKSTSYSDYFSQRIVLIDYVIPERSSLRRNRRFLDLFNLSADSKSYGINFFCFPKFLSIFISFLWHWLCDISTSYSDSLLFINCVQTNWFIYERIIIYIEKREPFYPFGWCWNSHSMIAIFIKGDCTPVQTPVYQITDISSFTNC